jgi:pimeloyl-ACP methyl ester carboxylesterase
MTGRRWPCGVLFLVLLFATARPGAQAVPPPQSPVEGRWQGAILIMGSELKIEVTFKTAGTGLTATIDIPQQGAAGLPLTAVRHEAGKVHFELQAGPGLAVWDGELKGGEISGRFTQAGIEGTFALKRPEEKAALAPSEPLPYAEEEVKVQNGPVTLAGTLTLPQTGKPFPAVVMISGSGAQNRDEEVFGFKLFRLLADHLSRNGFAVLRMDDRGVGGSTGSVAASTSEDFAGDALAEVTYLKGRPDIDPKRIGLCGHSEGGLVAPIAAARSSDVAFIVLMAPPGLTGEKIMIAQGEAIGRAVHLPEADIQKNAELQRKIFAAVRAGQGVIELGDEIRRLALERINELPAEQRRAISNPEQYAEKTADQQIKGVQSAWFRFFLDYDPAPALTKVRCPVLAVFGELDLQVVPHEENQKAIAGALERGGNKDHTLKTISKANHLFQDATTGSPSEYATLKKEFAPGFLAEVTAWLKAKAGVR